jgi:hypothetical protein
MGQWTPAARGAGGEVALVVAEGGHTEAQPAAFGHGRAQRGGQAGPGARVPDSLALERRERVRQAAQPEVEDVVVRQAGDTDTGPGQR